MRFIAPFIVIAALAFTCTTSADAPAGAIAQMGQLAEHVQTQRQLIATRHQIEGIDYLAEKGVVTAAQANESRKALLARASEIAGHQVTLPELVALGHVDAPVTHSAKTPMVKNAELTWLQKAAGFITWMNVMIFFAVIFGAICVIALFGSLIKDIPGTVYEVGLYLLAAGAIFGARALSDSHTEYIALFGCVLLGGALSLTSGLHHKKHFTGFAGLLTVVSAGVAITYASTAVGFFAVIALLSTLGFSVASYGLCYAIGFSGKDAVARTTMAAFMILGIYVLLTAIGVRGGMAEVFRPGALFMGSFVGYLGLLISSSKWYAKDNYVLLQVVTLVLGLAAIFLGSVLGISELTKIGGTFFALWILEKTAEIPMGSVTGYSFLGIIVCTISYFTLTFLKAHPETFGPYLFM